MLMGDKYLGLAAPLAHAAPKSPEVYSRIMQQMLDTLFTKLYVLAKDYAIYLIMLSARNIFRQTTPASVHN
jgi:hypothetical protein